MDLCHLREAASLHEIRRVNMTTIWKPERLRQRSEARKFWRKVYSLGNKPCSIANATACVRELTSNFTKMPSTWKRTVRSLTPRMREISQLVLPCFIHINTVVSRGESPLTRLESGV